MSTEDRSDLLAMLGSVLRSRNQEVGALQQVADWVTRSVERTRQRATTLRFLHPEARDQLVGVGEAFELTTEVSALSNLTADSVRFFTGARAVGEVPIEAGAAYLVTSLDSPGVVRAHHEALGENGQVLRRGPEVVIQVVDSRPVVLLDADVVFGDPTAFRHLRRLAELDVNVAWVDLSPLPRAAEIRARLARHAVPVDAVLSHPREASEVTSLSVFLRTIVRRLRASGVAVVAFISAMPDEFIHRAGDEIEIVAPRAISDWLRDLSWRARVGAEARELHERRASSDRFAFRLDESTQTRALPGNLCEVDFDNRHSREAIFEAMEAAESTIEMQVYIVEDGRFMDQLGAHLIRAARRGIQVRLLVDALFSRHGALGMQNPILDALRRQEGIDVRAKDPVPVTDLLELQALKRRDHRKLFVIDGDRAFVSGRNAGDAYYTGFDEVAVTDGTLHERIPWLDAHVEVRGPLVSEISASFERAWEASGGHRREPPPAGPGVGGALARLVVHDGDEDANGMAAYEAILDAAEDHVYIVNDFPVVSRLVAAVRRAVGRGVRVRLLTGSALARRDDGSFFRGPIYRELFEHMTKGRLEPLMRRGLEVYEYRTPPGLPLIVSRGGSVRPYVHAKLMAADGRVASVGSANLDATASYWEREANIVIEDADTVGQVEGWVEAALEHAVRIGPQDEHWQKETRLREVVSRLWPDSLYS